MSVGDDSRRAVTGGDHRASPLSVAPGVDLSAELLALRESEEQYRRMFEEAPLGYQSLDAEGRLLAVNEAWLDTLGYAREDVIGRWFGDFLAPAQVELFRQRFPRFKENGRVHTQFDVRRADGTYQMVEFDGRIASAQDGGFLRTHCIVADAGKRDRLRLALERSNEGVWELDLAAGTVYLSPRGCSILGLEPGEAPALVSEWDDLLHPEDAEASRALLSACVEGGQPGFEVEQRMRTASGRWAWLLARGRAVAWDAAGDPIRVVGTLSDITLQKDMERRLQEQEERLQAVLDNSPYGMHLYRLEPDDRLVFAGYNRTAQTMLGIDHATLIGRTLEEAFPGNAGGETARAYREAARHGTSYENTEYAYDASGIAGVFVVHAFGYGRNEAAVFFRDITQRRMLEVAADKSERRYRDLFDSIQEGYAYCRMLYDQDDRPVDWVYLAVNPAFERITGLRGVDGKRATDAIPGIEEGNPELFEIYGRVARSGAAEEFEVDLKALDLWLHVSVHSPERDHFIATFEDVSDRKQAEHEAELFASAVESASMSVVITDDSGRILFANRHACGLLGAGEGELRGRHLEGSGLRLETETWSAMFSTAGAREDARVLATLGAGVSPVPLEIHVSNVRVGEQQLTVLFAHEITERVAAETALAERERTLSTLMGNLPGMAFRCAMDEHWTLEFVSAGCEELTGYAPEQLLYNSASSFEEMVEPARRGGGPPAD